MQRKNVWSKDFSLITVGTIISSIAGQAITLPFSLLVFDQTQSTLLAAIMFVSGALPNFLLPLFIAPLIDRGNKKRIIVTIDYITGILYMLVAVIYTRTGFNYELFVIFSFIAGIINSIYSLTYSSWYPDLIPAGFEQQGYAVSSSIYPTVIMVMAPIAAWLYNVMPVQLLLVSIGILTLIAATFELFISNIGSRKVKESMGWPEYIADCKAGFAYLRKEKGLRNIYSYMAITSGVATGVQLMVQAYFQTVRFLTVAMLGFLKTAETLGRVLGGFVQYKLHIKPEKRFSITKIVYFSYETLDLSLLFMPYPFMIINRFIGGVMGITSFTMREAAVQAYLPAHMRAKVNAIFTVAVSLAVVVFQLGAGYVGDVFGYRRAVILFSTFSLLSVIGFIAIPSAVNRKIYEVTRNTDQDSLA